MPWERCEQPILDDAAGPARGLTKVEWTLEVDGGGRVTAARRSRVEGEGWGP